MPVDVQKLRIIHYPAPILRSKAHPVAEIDDEVREVARRMLELMHQAPGVGLAAPQIGLGWRMFVANPTGEPADDRVYINPELVDPGEALSDHEEGCLSLPDIRGDIRRPTRITMRATDLEGNAIEETSDELLARVWQHEFDHLDGVLIIDRMPRIDRMAAQRKLKELEARYRK